MTRSLFQIGVLRSWLAAAFVAAAAGLATCVASAQEPTAESLPVEPVIERSLPSVATETLGGTQFWSDELVFHDWRIQRHVTNGHYRLLDDRGFRRAWGTFEQCRARLNLLKEEYALPPLKRRVVLTMHGVIRSRSVMEGLGEYLEDHGEFTVLNVSYASTRRTLDEHAESFARVLENLDGVEEIHFVGHSLGNLVLRRYLGEATAEKPRWRVDTRIKRIVMLAPPNQGAKIAESFKNNKLIGLIWGPCCKQLANEWSELEKQLAIPSQEFGIIAGGRGDDEGVNPFVAGDDDLVLSIDETRLPGARDFSIVNRMHGGLMNDDNVRKQVLTFLNHGYFVSAEARNPIPAADSVASAEATAE
jgi:pimeloyl-ACP methyl ester carboxylesterase